MHIPPASTFDNALAQTNNLGHKPQRLSANDKRWLEQQLEKWARWVDQGCVMPRGYQSIFGLIADYKDTWVHCESNSRLPDWGIEFRIEALLSSLQPQKPRWVTILRAEMGVFKATKDCITQREKATALGISMRSYAYDLTAIKQALMAHLRA